MHSRRAREFIAHSVVAHRYGTAWLVIYCLVALKRADSIRYLRGLDDWFTRFAPYWPYRPGRAAVRANDPNTRNCSIWTNCLFIKCRWRTQVPLERRLPGGWRRDCGVIVD